MAASYQLRCQIFGHEKDVRAVTAAILPENAIVSGSRDLTARVWVPIEGENGFQEGHCMSGHSNFVASVCCLPPDDKHPHGLIFTGSNDSTILAFTLDSPQPLYKLEGHTSTVCALASGKFGTLLSGSWDKTAKVWLSQKCVMTLEGHGSAVWAVAIMPEQGTMLTGSADKTIKVWKAGKCVNTIKGHEDCVRGLAVTQGSEFLSCSNDATIRRWLLSGDCLQVYYGHENFVYSIAVLPNGQDFVTSGEDRTVRVWRNGENTQTITHPTLSIWTVCTLVNGDIVSGASDGTIRVFTNDPKRIASTEELKAYDDQIAASQVPQDIKPEQLPGPEALNNPGTYFCLKMRKGCDTLPLYNRTLFENNCPLELIFDRKEKVCLCSGTKRDRQSGTQCKWEKVELYSWDRTVQQWKKEYDYVFSVDIEEGKPPLKLPYNISEDPWFAAQNFISNNNLSQLFLDQVANFIIDNTKGVTLNQSSGYSDPFTGYNIFPGSGSDTSRVVVLPHSQERGGLNQLYEGERKGRGRLGRLEGMMKQVLPSDDDLNTLKAVLEWPPNIVFPAIDVLRITIKFQEVNQPFCASSNILEEMFKYWSDDSPAANQILSLKVVCNMFAQPQGFKLCMDNRDKTLTRALNLKQSKNKNVQISLGTLLLNYSVGLFGTLDLEGKSQTLAAAVECMKVKPDVEAAFRIFIAMGTLIHKDESVLNLAQSMNVMPLIGDFLNVHNPKKVGECAGLLAELFR
ncbi:phospholipase A-2-activating protein-like [Mercenaria mercenaria]|uniref:phospholipase A-2-activating protein-like n=1 Tax=Mercenaria mercenaria TaxID=6596 RepID=UPI00234E6CA8|nr:phospholipase A-2-activating protein-like [Mercenaria mercenaria]